MEEHVLVDATALHLAIYYDMLDVVRVLISQAAAVLHIPFGPQYLRQTPLHLACYLGRINIAILLLQHSADVNEADFK